MHIALKKDRFLLGEDIEITFVSDDFPPNVLGTTFSELKENEKVFCQGGSMKDGPENTRISKFEYQAKEAGFFEVVRLAVHSEKDGEEPEFLYSGKDYPRLVFHIGDGELFEGDVLQAVIDKENSCQQKFLQGINIAGPSLEPNEYQILVFVKGIGIPDHIRLGFWELQVFSALDAKDNFDLVNDYVSRYTAFNTTFDYEQAKGEVRSDAPVTVGFFPKVEAVNENAALEFAVNNVELLIDALALYSRGGGEIISTVVADVKAGSHKLEVHSRDRYAGNRSLVQQPGGDATPISNIVKNLSDSRINRLYAELFKQALQEKSVDYKYLRLWMILELMSDAKDYDSDEVLLDESGEEMCWGNGDKIILRQSPKARVFKMLKEDWPNELRCFIEGTSLWRYVGYWYGFRNAVAHCGGYKHKNMPGNFDHTVLCEEAYELQGKKLDGPVLKSLHCACQYLALVL